MKPSKITCPTLWRRNHVVDVVVDSIVFVFVFVFVSIFVFVFVFIALLPSSRARRLITRTDSESC